MKNIFKSLLALSLVFSLGLSAAEDKTGKPVVEVQSKTKQAAVLAASVVANVLALGTIAVTNKFIFDNLEMSFAEAFEHRYALKLAYLVSNLGMAHASSYIIKKLGLKTNTFALYAISSSGIPDSILIDYELS